MVKAHQLPGRLSPIKGDQVREAFSPEGPLGSREISLHALAKLRLQNGKAFVPKGAQGLLKGVNGYHLCPCLLKPGLSLGEVPKNSRILPGGKARHDDASAGDAPASSSRKACPGQEHPS